MADTVTTKTVFSGTRHMVMNFTNLSDGTGESAVTKIDKSTLVGPNGLEPSFLMIEDVQFNLYGMAVRIYVDATSPLTLLQLGEGTGDLNYKHAGGLSTKAAGATGDILFTTAGATANDSYDITIKFRLHD